MAHLFEHLLGERSLQLHHELQHLVVAAARKQDLPCVQLVQAATNRPHVHGVVIREPQDCREQVVRSQDGTTEGLQQRKQGVIIKWCFKVSTGSFALLLL